MFVGAGGSGVTAMANATTTVSQAHVKSLLAYTHGAHTHSVRFSHSKRTFDRRNYKHLIAVANIFYRNSDRTRLIYCTCIEHSVYQYIHIYIRWMFQPTHNHTYLRQLPSFLTHSLNQPTKPSCQRWMYTLIVS